MWGIRGKKEITRRTCFIPLKRGRKKTWAKKPKPCRKSVVGFKNRVHFPFRNPATKETKVENPVPWGPYQGETRRGKKRKGFLMRKGKPHGLGGGNQKRQRLETSLEGGVSSREMGGNCSFIFFSATPSLWRQRVVSN